MINTVSLKLAKLLKKVGYPQLTSHFTWAGVTRPELFQSKDIIDGLSRIADAPTAEEVLDVLPGEIFVKNSVIKTGLLRISKDKEGYWIRYVTPSGTTQTNFESYPILAEAAGRMYLYLKLQKLI